MRSPLTLLLSASLLAASLAACSDDAAEGGAAAAGGPPGGMQLPVEAVTLEPESLSAGLQTVGSLRADESVVVRPEVAGRIVRIHFAEGGRVSAGQPLFSLDSDVARAALAEAQANLANSNAAAARAEQLIGEKLIARADYDQLTAQRAVDRARVASAQAALSKMTLRAPFAGQVGLREVSVGDFVSAGDEMVTLVRTDPIEVDFSVPETRLQSLRPGQPIQVTVDAYPGDVFGGEVIAIAPTVDRASRSVQLRARVANPDGRLLPGQFARLQLGGGGTQALLVPEQALMQQGEERFVYAVVDGKAKRTVVETGARVPGKVEVTSGLQAGDVVITAGQAKPMMFDGAGVMVLPPPGEGAPAGDAAPDGAAPPEAAETPADETPQDAG
ncbi:efflux RND transporter periplasmic adaptor subunit [Luteimonas pelagia]